MRQKIIITSIILVLSIIVILSYFQYERNLFESSISSFQFTGANVTRVDVSDGQSSGANVTFTTELSYDNPTDLDFSIQPLAHAYLKMEYSTTYGKTSFLKGLSTFNLMTIEINQHSQGIITIAIFATLTEAEAEIILPFLTDPQFMDTTIHSPPQNVSYLEDLDLFCTMFHSSFIGQILRQYNLY